VTVSGKSSRLGSTIIESKNLLSISQGKDITLRVDLTTKLNPALENVLVILHPRRQSLERLKRLMKITSWYPQDPTIHVTIALLIPLAEFNLLLPFLRPSFPPFSVPSYLPHLPNSLYLSPYSRL